MRIRSEFLIGVVSRLLVILFRTLYLTVRIKPILAVPEGTPSNQDGSCCHTFCLWHDSLLTCIFGAKKPRMIALVGPHRDGSYVSQVLRGVGIRPVRGSSSRGGAKAIVEILRNAPGHDISMTPDGPRGPRRVMKSGCAFIAMHTGQPVVTLAVAPTRYWNVPGSWTTLAIPKPFSTVYVLTGRPIHIPPNSSRGQLEMFTQQIQAEMDRTHELADRLVAGEDFPVQELLSAPQEQRVAA